MYPPLTPCTPPHGTPPHGTPAVVPHVGTLVVRFGSVVVGIHYGIRPRGGIPFVHSGTRLWNTNGLLVCSERGGRDDTGGPPGTTHRPGHGIVRGGRGIGGRGDCGVGSLGVEVGTVICLTMVTLPYQDQAVVVVLHYIQDHSSTCRTQPCPRPGPRLALPDPQQGSGLGVAPLVPLGTVPGVEWAWSRPDVVRGSIRTPP